MLVYAMTNNDVIRSVRYILQTNNSKLAEIFALGGLKVKPQDIDDFMKDEEHPDYLRCDDLTMAHFLDGLIYFKRGKDDSRPPMPFEIPISNNLILKKLRVAFALKEPDMHEVMNFGGYEIGRAELSALLRKEGQPNYRECGDQVLRYFLKGLAEKFRH
jgi:uncharacterized protein YehS (DUF1456 family)